MSEPAQTQSDAPAPAGTPFPTPPRTREMLVARASNLVDARADDAVRSDLRDFGQIADDSEAAAIIQDARTLKRQREYDREQTAERKRSGVATSGENQGAVLIRLGKTADLFKTPDGERFATVEAGEHSETFRIRSRDFKEWLAGLYIAEKRQPPGSAGAMEAAILELERQAKHGATHELHVRVAREGGRIYIDLGDDTWDVIEIGADGWRVIPGREALVKFRRPAGLRALPRPVKGGSLDLLRGYINAGEEKTWALIAAWLVGTLSEGPFPVLALAGEQGSAKSATTRALRKVLDPSVALTQQAPRDIRDLAIAAHNSHVLAFDNLSRVREELSDGLCCISTGQGFRCRSLYENDRETIFSASRPAVMNGITELATRADLLDRSLVLNLPPIAPENRRVETDLDAGFERDHPAILGALCDAAACALRRLDSTKIPPAQTPRMADFAKWVEAAAPSLGWGAGDFLAFYSENRELAAEVALEASPVAAALIACGVDFRGTSAELSETLRGSVSEDTLHSKAWPQTPRALLEHVKRITPALRSQGWRIEWGENVRVGPNRARGIDIGAPERPSGLDL